MLVLIISRKKAPGPKGRSPQMTTAVRMASPAQYTLVGKLLGERDLEVTPLTDRLVEAYRAQDLDSRDVRILIDLLFTAPRKPAQVADVPEGRYALRNTDGSVTFWKVDRPTEGKWAGAVFCKQIVSDYEQRHPMSTQKAIMARIFADIEGAMALYGQEIGRCGHCHRQLTSDWRLRGIGPSCFRKAFGRAMDRA